MSVTPSQPLHAPSRSWPISLPISNLPPLLAVIAGMVDLSGFVALGGVFTAHITGNLVVLAAVAVRGGTLNPALALAVPIFMIATAGVWFVIRRTGGHSPPPSRIVLVAQFLLLAAVLAICVASNASQHPRSLAAGAAVLLAASAMASQYALLHMQIAGAPSTAVMTGNLVSTVIYSLEAFVPEADRRAAARARLARLLPLLLGFVLGGVCAAAALLVDRNWGWVLPVALAGLVAITTWRQER
jgi:uncharacterized membrane protein YoaK (UPF0700 family)